MIGREAMGQPWLVGQVAQELRGEAVREPSPAARLEAAVDHYESLLGLYGLAVGLRHARKHLAAYADRAGSSGLALSAKDRLQLVSSENPRLVVSLLRRVFEAPLREAA
jgi:tRNA-dihydrouridine synthase